MGRSFIIDGTTHQALKNVAPSLFKPGEINLTWDDVKTTVSGDDPIMLSFGSGRGPHRTLKACVDTLASRNTAHASNPATRVLFHLTGPDNLLLREVTDAVATIKEEFKLTTDPIYGVARDGRLQDEVKIILLASSDKKRQEKARKKSYSKEEQELVDDWCDRWLNFIELINNVTGSEQAPWSPPPPTVLEELEYRHLRSWFMDNQQQFTPLWLEFYRSHDWVYLPIVGDEELLPKKYSENHFYYFYESENLYKLAQQLALQSNSGTWEPSESRARLIRPLFIRLGQLMVEFTDFSDKQL